MKKSAIVATLASLVLLCGLGITMAQDFSQAPSYAETTLATGFMPDPHVVAMTAGGTINTATEGPAPPCGYVAAAPDFRLNWGGGGTLNIYAVAPPDVTPLISMPDASWQCNDDFNGTNPLVAITNAPAGQYDIWVGTYGTDVVAGTSLKISEMSPQW